MDAEARPAGGPHAAQEQVVDATEVAAVIVAGEALAQVAVQGQRIQQVLQVVAAIQHRLAQLVRRVVVQCATEEVALVVGDIEAALVLEDQVDDAGDHAAEVVDSDGRQRLAGGLLQACVEGLDVHPADGEIEGHFIEPLAGGELAQAQAPFVQRRVDDVTQPALQGVAVMFGIEAEAWRQPRRQLGDLGLHPGLKVQPLQQQVQEGADVAAGGKIQHRVFAARAAAAVHLVDVTGQGGEAGHAPVAGDAAAELGGREGWCFARGQGRRLAHRRRQLADVDGGAGRGQPLQVGRQILADGKGSRQFMLEIVRRLRRVQQPGQRTGARAASAPRAHLAPGQVDLGLRPRQRHVGEADLLGQSLLLRQAQRLWVAGDGSVQTGPPLAVVIGHQFAVRRGFETAPQGGQKHQRVFQPLTLVDGDDVDQRLVALQAQLGLFVGVVVQLPAVPAEQGVQARVGSGRRLQQLAEVQQVGEAALGILAAGDAVADVEALQQGLEHAHETALLPQAVEFAQLVHPLQPAPLIEGDGRHAGVVVAQQFAGQGVARRVALVALDHRLQQQRQAVRLAALIDLVAAHADGGNAARLQLAAQRRALGAGAHQHGDVARAQGPFAEPRLAARGGRQQAGDLRRGGPRQHGLRLALAEGFALFVRRDAPQREGGGGLPAQAERGVALAHRRRGGAHRLPVDGLGVDEGVPAPAEHGIHRLDQPRQRAPVGVEAVARRAGVALGAQVGEDVAAAKTVDGLLGVANQG